jgi:hypothetical protein
MVHDDPTAQLQEELAAMKRQMRQLLEIVALVQSQQSNARSSEQGTAASLPRAAAEPASTASTPTGDSSLTTSGGNGQTVTQYPAVVASLFEENRRLQEIVRTQAEELGTLRERLARLETEPADEPGASQALAALVRALRDTP